MNNYKFDVVIIGAGPAGVAAAGALAGTGISVALLEAGVYAGAENWSGCVYFTESLAAQDCFGPEAVAAAPFERPVRRRGTLMHNGLDVVGLELADDEAFTNCYTVLRPVYDPYFAHLARVKGAVHLTETTVTSLIRKDGRVVGVETSRGPLYADVVFIAEGDASHLVRSEQLERTAQPHFLQGVKAVVSLRPGEIEKRFRLGPGEGAAYELLIRNASIGGRSAKLNAGGFLYTNRDSLSVGYVAPLDNVRNNFRGSHDGLFEWMRGLPYIKDLIEGAPLSAYGTKIIRSGGWKERPVLVEDGLAVGGASAGLGVDIPFPNFTGPASATGLFFARAVKAIFLRGRAPDAKNLTKEYLAPLSESVYGKNARHLSRWPAYFGGSKALFGRTVDLTCGTAHFLSTGSLVETGRFLRGHILSLRGISEIFGDTSRAIKSLRLRGPVLRTCFHPATIGSWFANIARTASPGDSRLGIILHINGGDIDAATLPWPVGGLIKRLAPALTRALEQVYSNDERPAEAKFEKAARELLRGLSLTDFVVLPAFGMTLLFFSLATAIWDALRFYVLKTPVDKLLAEPVPAYNESQRKARDLDGVRPALSLEGKLATNTYRVGSVSHIRTLWPESRAAHADLSQAGLWWVCPARVYVYDAPLFGRGRVTVNYENCIKCESCWRAEPARALWGRHTDHRLIYRPESSRIDLLRDHLFRRQGGPVAPPVKPAAVDDRLWNLTPDVVSACGAVLNAASAFEDAVGRLPPSADKGRRAWPLALGRRLREKLINLETVLANDGRPGPARAVQSERTSVEQRLAEGRLFQALYRSRGIERMLHAWTAGLPAPALPEGVSEDPVLSYDEVSKLFPDRFVKEWEEGPIPPEWAEKLRAFISGHQDRPFAAIRALSSVSPALGLIAAHQVKAAQVLANAGGGPEPGLAAVAGDHLDREATAGGVRIKGTLPLTPVAASRGLLIISGGKGFLVPLSFPGVKIVATPAIGFRAAGLSDVMLDCEVGAAAVPAAEQGAVPDPASYLAIALGAADYLCGRIREHASGRVQFPGQMLDTEGRDGIAKLGAVKALIARTEAWRLLLETLCNTSEPRAPHPGLLSSSLAALAFGPEPGAMGYDAGQVFGGFAYSEDDLLSRCYRDSSLFRFLPPGYGAAKKLNQALGSDGVAAFLTEVKKLRGEPLGPLASRLTAIAASSARLSPEADASLAGEAKALIIATGLLLLSIEQGLEGGGSREAEAAAAEVLLGIAEEGLKKAAQSTGRGIVEPAALFPAEPAGTAAALDGDYESFCTAPGAPHKSGGFLTTVFDRSARFVPEMQLHDQRLRARWSELTGWFKRHCSDKTFDGLHIERYIEKIHGLPAEVVEAIKRNRWLATYIPASEDGLGWRKAEYYILNSAAGSFGDAGINLLIMANTSIGTTPILLGLKEELPRVEEELAPLARDAARLGELGSRLGRIVQSLESPNPSAIKKEYESLMKLVDERIRKTRVVKYLAANFLRSFYAAGMAGRRGDFGGFGANLRRAGDLFAKLAPDVQAALDELPRRERCHKLFLRYLGHGGVSAFALTEPTAGSDSGGVKTTARLQRRHLTPLDDGRYSFTPADGNDADLRYLIDADGIVFAGDGIAYRTPDNGTAPILSDTYDYGTDQGVRHYRFGGRECPFHDIGQVRKTESGLVYEYYSLTGAKMWITNGSIATQFCLYTQTPEGVTGFMVDRHAEGLKVGADEKKTGQRGSYTNELSLDNVRVPREAVIGYEGHGQVNALETLNVGRCGLSVVSGALIRKLMQEAAANIAASPERDSLLGEAAAIQFGSESLAYYLVGLFDRPHESVRMESAIAKYACSEDLHEVITLIERAYGPVGQTEKFLLEKARRDSRILNIYEGTNEVQRFLILKDLISRSDQWPELTAPSNDGAGETLFAWKNKLRGHVREAAGLLGDACWSDAMLQPALFPLAEMAGELLRIECISYRREWLEARRELLGAGYVEPLLAAGRRAAERTLAQLEHLDRVFARSWELVTQNIDMPEVRAADAALDGMAEQAVVSATPLSPLRAPFRILSIVRPVAELSPTPRLSQEVISEFVWRLDPLDRAAMSQALELKARSGPHVAVDVVMTGTAGQEHLLRTCAGADRLVRLNVENGGPEALAEAIRTLELMKQYDLIIVGSECLNGEKALDAYLAGVLRRTHYRRGRLASRADGLGLERVAPPAVMCITQTPPVETAPGISRIVESAFSPVMTLEPSRDPAVQPRFDRPAGAAVSIKTITSAAGAAELLRLSAAAESSARAGEYTGEIVRGRLPEGKAVWVVLDPREVKTNGAALRAGGKIAATFRRPLVAFVPAPRDTWRSLLGMAAANGADQAYCLDTGTGMLGPEGKREALRLITKTADTPIITAGKYWTEPFGFVAGEAALSGRRIAFSGGLSGMSGKDRDSLALSLPAYDGRLVRKEALRDASAFIALSPDAEFPRVAPKESFTASDLDFALDAAWLTALPPEARPSLAGADVIIDLGYGIRDRAGLELAQELGRKLAAIGLSPMFGATRKVTQDLKLLPLEAQIGQTGLRVNPRLIIALGISGAPQHIDYIGTRCDVLCFNKDTEAPLMKLNRTRPVPRVHPIAGDLFVTVRELIGMLD